MTIQERAPRPGWPWVVSLAVMAYLALLLVPNRLPSVGGTKAFFIYFLTIPALLLALAGLGVWGGCGFFRSRLRAERPKPRHRAFFLIACIGVASFALVFGLTRSLPRALPTGSHLQPFNRSLWQEPRSSDPVENDITPRQKMLADVVTSILPGRTRAELQEVLGPSLDTLYFASTGRDLIYVLGPQRDSFLAIDSEWLLIWLDEAGRFERYAIAND